MKLFKHDIIYDRSIFANFHETVEEISIILSTFFFNSFPTGEERVKELLNIALLNYIIILWSFDI